MENNFKLSSYANAFKGISATSPKAPPPAKRIRTIVEEEIDEDEIYSSPVIGSNTRMSVLQTSNNSPVPNAIISTDRPQSSRSLSSAQDIAPIGQENNSEDQQSTSQFDQTSLMNRTDVVIVRSSSSVSNAQGIQPQLTQIQKELENVVRESTLASPNPITTSPSSIGPVESHENDTDIAYPVILSVSFKGGKLGGAYYDKQTLHLLEDFPEGTSWDAFKSLKMQVRPTVIIVSSRSSDEFLQAANDHDDLSFRKPKVVPRPSTEFLYQSSKSKLLSLPLFESSTAQYRDHDIDWLCGIVDMNCHEMVGACGALLTYLERETIFERPSNRNPDNADEFEGLHGDDNMEWNEEDVIIGQQAETRNEIVEIQKFILKSYLHLNADAYFSLQIFQNETHPGIHGKSQKEGISLFGLLDLNVTRLGKDCLRNWFLKPERDISIIQDRQDCIEYFKRDTSKYIADSIRSCLKQIKNIRKIILKLRTKLTVSEWSSLMKFGLSAIKIRQILAESGSNGVPIADFVLEVFDTEALREVCTYINDVIDFGNSKLESRYIVNPHVSEELDALKRTYDGLGDFLSQVAREISPRIPTKYAKTINVLYFPQLGFLVTIPLSEDIKEAGDFEIEGLIYQVN
ncbi:MutS protein msh5 [Nowakowskiella sp. JEL0407]|nr:MutS protein msh5 [Nowakowskiella sp. JEL0407]